MRRILQAIGIAAILFFWVDTLLALYGPGHLPPRIPVHFDAAGHVNGWGTPGMLWLMPIIGTLVYGLMAWVSRHPGAFNFPVRVTPSNRPCLQSAAQDMIAWLKAEIACLFAWIQWATIGSARAGSAAISPIAIALFIALIWATILFYAVRMARTARNPSRG